MTLPASEGEKFVLFFLSCEALCPWRLHVRDLEWTVKLLACLGESNGLVFTSLGGISMSFNFNISQLVNSVNSLAFWISIKTGVYSN